MKAYIKSFIALILIITVSSCGDDFYDINEDPNASGVSTEALTFPSGVGALAFVMGGQYQILGAIWSQHWTQSVGANQYAYIDNYDLKTNSFDTRQFGTLYADALSDFNYVSKTAKANENWTYFLMSEIMTAYTYQVLVDFYGTVPYTEAFKGDEGLLTPKYDPGQAIYDSLIVRIDAALSKDLTARTAKQPGTDDVVFGGDMEQWVRLANTIKLKLYMRQSEARPEVARAGIQSLFNSGAEFLASNAAFTAFTDALNKRNPYYATQISTDEGGRGNVDVAASNTALLYLLDAAAGDDAVTDPRIDTLFKKPVNGGEHRGLAQGFYNDNSVPTTTARGLSQPLLLATSPVYFMTEAESYFLQAEAVVRYEVAGDAKDLYEQGIEAAFNRLAKKGASDLYADGARYAFPAAGTEDERIGAIIVQKWLSMINIQGVEAFFEHNRTGYPKLFVPSRYNVTGGGFPRRLLFPDSEYSRNTANVPTLEPVTSPVWWDVD